jgi:superfamily II DNA/RNA helicase
VINVDITPDPEVHVHRIGRTGRAGETGLALSLASMNEMGAVGKIEQYQNIESAGTSLKNSPRKARALAATHDDATNSGWQQGKNSPR